MDDIWDKRYFSDIENIKEIYNFLDAFHDYCIDSEAGLESGNWGCPVEGSEEEREILNSISLMGFEMLRNIKDLIEFRKRNP